MIDDDALDVLIYMLGQSGTLALLTREEFGELNEHMHAWTGAHSVKEVGNTEWYAEKRRKFLEIINRRKESTT